MSTLATTSFLEFLDIVAWPFVALAAIGFLASNRGRRLLFPILRRIRRLSGRGFAIELTAEAAGATKADVEGTLRDYAQALELEFQRLAYQHGVRDHMRTVVAEQLPEVGGDPKLKTYRATIHVKDALFTDALYQLVDYYPKGGGSGRRFSTRFGMLGRAWRLRKSISAPDVSLTKQDLIEQWGMTQEQAENQATGRQSFVCVVLEGDGGSPLGVLYLDAEPEAAFPAGVEDRFTNSALAPLCKAVQEVSREIAKGGPGIRELDHV